MSAVIASTCSCSSIGRTDLRQCPEHHHIWRGDVRLASVGRVIRETWPKPEKMPPDDVLENARDRGEVTDRLFSEYVMGRLTKIPAGTRKDAEALFYKLKRWFDAQRFRSVESQVLVACDDVGGILDLRLDGMVCDLKCTYKVDPTHVMQVAGYASMSPGSDDIAILHVTERYPEARLIHYGGAEIDDWNALLTCWRMIQRRMA